MVLGPVRVRAWHKVNATPNIATMLPVPVESIRKTGRRTLAGEQVANSSRWPHGYIGPPFMEIVNGIRDQALRRKPYVVACGNQSVVLEVNSLVLKTISLASSVPDTICLDIQGALTYPWRWHFLAFRPDEIQERNANDQNPKH